MKICAECLRPLESFSNESAKQLIINPIPLNNALGTCYELIESLKYFNLENPNPDKNNKILSISQLAYRLAIFKIDSQNLIQTNINVYLLPRLNSTYVKKFRLKKNNQKQLENFNNYLFNVISEEYSLWCADLPTFELMIEHLDLKF
jgi:hypothetical protein